MKVYKIIIRVQFKDHECVSRVIGGVVIISRPEKPFVIKQGRVIIYKGYSFQKKDGLYILPGRIIYFDPRAVSRRAGKPMFVGKNPVIAIHRIRQGCDVGVNQFILEGEKLCAANKTESK